MTSTPPLSRQSSTARAAELAKANINPLKEGEGQTLDPERTLVIASRASQLALVQSSQVSAALSASYGRASPAFPPSDESSPSPSPSTSKLRNGEPLSDEEMQNLRERIKRFNVTEPMSFPITSMSTAGDQNVRSPLYVIGGEGRAIWTGELEVALAAGAVDAVVHSLKDVPTTLPDGFVLGAISEREDPRDALCIKSGLPYKTLDDLPPGSVIGTSSVRRVAQLRARYPGLVFSDVRGNINTRLAKLDAPTGPYTALVLAAAGLIRINLAHRITAFLSRPVLLHAVGQGSLGIEVRKPPPGATPENNRDARILAMVQSIGDWRATARAEAERALLRELEGGCSIPVGVETYFEDHDEVEGVRNEKVDVAASVEGSEGHTITKAAVGETTSGSNGVASRPATLERLATGGSAVNVNAHANAMHRLDSSLPTPVTEDPPNLATAATDESSIQALLKPARAEDRSRPPTSPVKFTMTAIVVSLDGSRHCQHTMSRAIASIDEARALGVEVAQELADRQGAREILDEVNHHRQMAEEADNRRREEARKRRKIAEDNARDQQHDGGGGVVAPDARTAQLKASANANTSAPTTSSPLASSGTSTPVEERKAQQEGWRKLEEVLQKTTNGRREGEEHDMLANYPQAGGEIDRRGVPREDGQEKVWEV